MKITLPKGRKEKDPSSLSGRIYLGLSALTIAFVLILLYSALLGRFSLGQLKSMITLYVFLAVFVVIPASVLVEKLGGSLGSFLSFRWGRTTISPRQRLAGKLDKSRYLKTQGAFTRALEIVNDVLGEDPDFPDALFLKAQILREGFDNLGAAKGCLKKIMELTGPEETIHRWARNYYQEVEQSFVDKDQTG
jgi:hypothetical protein